MKLIKSFSAYTFVGILSTGISLLVMPILTYYLTPADYGILALFNSYVLITIPFLGLTTTSIIGLKYFELNKPNFRDLVFSILMIVATGLFISSTLFYIFKLPLARLLEIPSEWLFLIPIISAFVIISETLQTLLIIKKKVKLYSKAVLSKVIFEVLMSIILIAIVGLGWLGRINSWLMASFSMMIFAMFYFHRQGYFKGHLKLKWIKQSLLFGIPLIPHLLGKLIINQSDKIFLSKMISLESTGLYSVGYLVGSFILIISTGAMNVFSPFMLERLTAITETKKIEIIRFSYIILAGLALVFLLLNLSTPFIFKYILAEQYAESANYVFWISLSYFFWGIYLVFTGYIFFLKKTFILSILSVVSISINLIANYFFILEFGSIGAAYATALSFFALAILIILITQRIYPMPWLSIKKIVKIER